ncbi:MAG: thioredoxin domain-containing protein, partial [Candidatus Peribacteraceae bacterium]|nr:thioredoxin domain-containing protein [Candidatus Peribacteraceae bacterium]
AARGFLCAVQQGKGFAMHSTLFANVNKARDAQRSYAQTLGVDLKKFDECLQDPATDALLAAQKTWAQSLSVSVVPVFFLNGEKMIGLPYYPDLRGKIEEAMKEAKEQ